VTKYLKIDQNNLHMKFSALNADFSSLSADCLGSRRPAHASVKEGYPSNNGHFTDIAASSMNIVADRHRHPAPDRPGQPVYKIFSIQRRYIFNNLSFDVLNSRSLPYGGVKFEYFLKTHYYFIACCTVIARVAGPLLLRVT